MDLEEIELIVYDFAVFADDFIPSDRSEMEDFLYNYPEKDQDEVFNIVNEEDFSVVPTERLKDLLQKESELKFLWGNTDSLDNLESVEFNLNKEES